MSGGLHKRLAAVLTAVALLCAAVPTVALAEGQVPEYKENTVPPAMDLLFLRPLGFAAAVVGGAIFVAVSPIVLLTRPTEIGKPFDQLVKKPIEYTWGDPIGVH